MSYSFFLGAVRLPVAPAGIALRYGNKVNTVELSDGREVLVSDINRRRRLAEIEFSALLPWNPYPFAVYTGGFKRGDVILNDIIQIQDAGKPFRFVVRRCIGESTPTPIDIKCVFRELRVREEAANGSDITVDVKLVEFRQAVTPSVAYNGVGVVPTEATVRPVETPPVQRTHTVVRGDSLWMISQRYLGNGNRWREIYELNRVLIDNRNRGTGNVYHTIYPGQVLRIP
jgi:LysM repeat protein